MPMHEFRRVGIVVDIDDDALAFLEAQQRPGKLAVVERGRDDVVGRELDQPGGDAQRVVGLFGGGASAVRATRGAALMTGSIAACLSNERRSIVMISFPPLQAPQCFEERCAAARDRRAAQNNALQPGALFFPVQTGERPNHGNQGQCIGGAPKIKTPQEEFIEGALGILEQVEA